MIIAFGTDGKGGTSKTTSAVNLTAHRAGQGHKVVLVDCDNNLNASSWIARRIENQLEPKIDLVNNLRGENIAAEIAELAKNYDDVIIDLDGSDSVELRGILLAADKFYIPLTPSQFDIWTITSMEGTVAKAIELNPLLKAFVFITRASTNPKVAEIEDVREMYSSLKYINLSEAVIRERVPFRYAISNGMGITEYKTDDNKAQQEFLLLYNEIYNEQ